MTQELGERLRGLRRSHWDRSLTQREVAHGLRVGVSSISGYESGLLSPPDSRLRDYATFFAVPVPPDRLPDEADLTRDQLAWREELLADLRALRPGTVERPAAADLWSFPTSSDQITLVCGALENVTHPYSSVRDRNFTDLLSFADLDALIELHGHVRMRNPDSEVRFVRADRLEEADDMSGHLVMLGGPGLNDTLQQVFDGTDLPIEQAEHPDVTDGEVFYLRDGGEPDLPVFSGKDKKRLTEDVALFARLVNPFNSTATLTWCSGIFSRGVLGAVRLLTDKTLRDNNGAYLADRFAGATQFAILARVPVVLGRALTPDLCNDDARLYEWSDADDLVRPGKVQSTGGSREANR